MLPQAVGPDKVAIGSIGGVIYLSPASPTSTTDKIRWGANMQHRYTLSASTNPALGHHTGRSHADLNPSACGVLALSRAAHRWLESLSLSLNSSSSSATPSHVSAFLHAPTDTKATMLLAAPIEVKASLLAALVLLVALSFACFRRRTVDSPRLPLRASMTSRLK